MPWDAAGAKKHKKDLSDTEAKRWASIANGVLESCMTAGGSEKSCAGQAIKSANSAINKSRKNA